MCDVLCAVVYVHVRCFVMRGSAVLLLHHKALGPICLRMWISTVVEQHILLLSSTGPVPLSL